jgi:hypothetical protein
MQSLAEIVKQGNLQTSNGTEKITSVSSVEERREALYFILTEYREAYQLPPLEGDVMEIRITSWLSVTAPIPANRLRDVYAWAMQNRTSQYPLSAVELVDAWKHLVGRAETEGTSALRDDRLLPEKASGACLRCDKQGREISLSDGSVGGPCGHRPISEEEKQEAARVRQTNLEWAREEARKTAEANRAAEAAKEEAPKPVVVKMQCSVCHRRVDSTLGWTEGETCGKLIENSSCTGQMLKR